MKTPEELGLNQRTYDALLQVREKLASRKFRHLTEEEYNELTELKRKEGVFNMSCALDALPNGCGQVGCIGGWMSVQMGIPSHPDDGDYDCNSGNFRSDHMCHLMHHHWAGGIYGKDGRNPLYPLFMPENLPHSRCEIEDMKWEAEADGEDYDGPEISWDDLNQQHAVRAIDYYLQTGDALNAWKHATGNH